jgi:starch-binding outer membrane protein, SusD/RagB family
VQIDYTGSLDAEFKGATPAIQFRYADILLNYAEALAELDGVGNAQKIIDALQPLRDRVGMPPVDFDREYNQEADYGFRNLDKYIQAVRRERRVDYGRGLSKDVASIREYIISQFIIQIHSSGKSIKGRTRLITQ